MDQFGDKIQPVMVISPLAVVFFGEVLCLNSCHFYGAALQGIRKEPGLRGGRSIRAGRDWCRKGSRREAAHEGIRRLGELPYGYLQ